MTSSRSAKQLDLAITELIRDAKVAGDAVTDAGSNTGRRRWWLLNLIQQGSFSEDDRPSDLTDDEWDSIKGTLLHYEFFRSSFSRLDVEDVYKNEYEKENGRVARVISAKIQSDVLSDLERSFVSRHRTATRSRFHAGAFRRQAGSDIGVVSNIRRFIGLLQAEADSGQVTDTETEETIEPKPEDEIRSVIVDTPSLETGLATA